MENSYRLFDIIIQYSICDDWLEAKKEWVPYDFYCDHYGVIGCYFSKLTIMSI